MQSSGNASTRLLTLDAACEPGVRGYIKRAYTTQVFFIRPISSEFGAVFLVQPSQPRSGFRVARPKTALQATDLKRD